MSDMPLFDRPQGRGQDDEKEPRVFRVSEVNRAVRFTLEDAWGDVWIEGELSDVKRSGPGHVYFTLNDERDPAQIRGVMFAGDARRCRVKLENGARVKMRGGLSLYEPRGQFQLLARQALAAGAGDLAAEFERVRKKLEVEGLLDPERKRPLPRLPRVVGVVTSATSAALQDILRVSAGRCPVRIVVADCRVQGDGAPASIVAALEAIQRLPELEVVIVARGGGSAEDLWAFNDEAVARAIAACRVPIVAGVGHEVDVTIADLVADARAATPSNAAELVVPVLETLVAELEGLERRLARALETRIGRERLRLERLGRLLEDPRHVLAGMRRRLDAAEARLAKLWGRRLGGERTKLVELRDRLRSRDPRALLHRDRDALGRLRGRVEHAVLRDLATKRRVLAENEVALRGQARPTLARQRARFGALGGRLHALSPLAVLERGYAIALAEKTGRAVRRVAEVAPGDRLTVRVADGSFAAKVEGER